MRISRKNNSRNSVKSRKALKLRKAIKSRKAMNLRKATMRKTLRGGYRGNNLIDALRGAYTHAYEVNDKGIIVEENTTPATSAEINLADMYFIALVLYLDFLSNLEPHNAADESGKAINILYPKAVDLNNDTLAYTLEFVRSIYVLIIMSNPNNTLPTSAKITAITDFLTMINEKFYIEFNLKDDKLDNNLFRKKLVHQNKTMSKNETFFNRLKYFFSNDTSYFKYTKKNCNLFFETLKEIEKLMHGVFKGKSILYIPTDVKMLHVDTNITSRYLIHYKLLQKLFSYDNAQFLKQEQQQALSHHHGARSARIALQPTQPRSTRSTHSASSAVVNLELFEPEPDVMAHTSLHHNPSSQHNVGSRANRHGIAAKEVNEPTHMSFEELNNELAAIRAKLSKQEHSVYSNQDIINEFEAQKKTLEKELKKREEAELRKQADAKAKAEAELRKKEAKALHEQAEAEAEALREQEKAAAVSVMRGHTYQNVGEALADARAEAVSRKRSGTMKRESKKSNEHELTHYWFKAWPDLGVPDINYFIQLLEIVYTNIKQKPGTTVIHCSAGVGRTGTFYVALKMILDDPILLDYIYDNEFPPELTSSQPGTPERARKATVFEEPTKTQSGRSIEPELLTESSADSFPSKLEQRIIDATIGARIARNALMVQTEDQYDFLCDLFGFESEKTPIEKHKPGKIKRIIPFNKINSVYGYEPPSEKDPSTSDARAQTNKNRYGNVLVSNDGRVKIAALDKGIDGSFYINASILPEGGNKQTVEHFIATQCPTHTTIQDFYDMLAYYEHTVKRIVMLTGLVEGRLKCNNYINANAEGEGELIDNNKMGKPIIFEKRTLKSKKVNLDSNEPSSTLELIGNPDYSYVN
jgi:protein tyrosine phosphatase